MKMSTIPAERFWALRRRAFEIIYDLNARPKTAAEKAAIDAMKQELERIADSDKWHPLIGSTESMADWLAMEIAEHENRPAPGR